MVFEYILKQNDIDPEKDVMINQNIDFGSTAAAFSGGQGDFTVEFEPGATTLEAAGKGYVVASLGKESGYVPYTAFSAKKSYLEEHPDLIQSFTDALQKGMDYVNTHTPEEIAKVIQPQFKENDLETITTIVSRYYEQKTWKEDLIFNQDSFELLQDILEDAGELDSRTPYEDLVTTSAWIPAPPLESEPAILNTFFISIHSMSLNKYLLFSSAVPVPAPRHHRCLPEKIPLSWRSWPQTLRLQIPLFFLYLCPAFLWQSDRSEDLFYFFLLPGR